MGHPGEMGGTGVCLVGRYSPAVCPRTRKTFASTHGPRQLKDLLLCQLKAHLEHDSICCAKSQDQSPKQAKASQQKKHFTFSFLLNSSEANLSGMQWQAWLKCFSQNFIKTYNKPTQSTASKEVLSLSGLSLATWIGAEPRALQKEACFNSRSVTSSASNYSKSQHYGTLAAQEKTNHLENPFLSQCKAVPNMGSP